MPAMGARTTGVSTRSEPRVRDSGTTVMAPLSQAGPGRTESAGPGRSAAEQLLREVGADAVETDPLLAHRVALADRDGVVVEGLEVDRHAERRADLVLAAVAATDGTGVVELDVPVLAQLGGKGLRLRREVGVAAQREDRDLHRREARVELEHDALVDTALGVGRLVLGVGVDEERHQ